MNGDGIVLQVRQKVPSHADLFWPVVLSFRNLGGSADKEQLLQMVAATMGLGDDVTAIPHKNGPSSELGYRVGWVQTWLKQGGMLDNPQRGVWVLTSLGRNASKEDVEYLHANRRRDLSKRKKIDENNLDYTDAVQEEQKADREVSWQGELIDTLKAMPALAFERLTKLLLLQLGFSHVHVVGQSGDGGIDVLGIVKVNSVLSFKIIVQCKRFKGTVGPSDVRDFRGAMQGRTDKALFITTGRFTEAAKGEATRDGVPAIDLVDGEALALLLKDIQLGVKTEMVEKVSVVKEFFSNV